MYIKQWISKQILQKLSALPIWVRWTHHNEGSSHCEECLSLDGCWFLGNNVPIAPHHPHCHCTLDPVDCSLVESNVATYSDYGKFDPYLFNTRNGYTHNKEKLFAKWGYTVEDAQWLQAEIEKQAREKYLSGDYELGKLNGRGQRISIRIVIPNRNGVTNVSFLTGWMVKPDGKIRLVTPYGGK